LSREIDVSEVSVFSIGIGSSAGKGVGKLRKTDGNDESGCLAAIVLCVVKDLEEGLVLVDKSHGDTRLEGKDRLRLCLGFPESASGPLTRPAERGAHVIAQVTIVQRH
jgi:hypothetical protein